MKRCVCRIFIWVSIIVCCIGCGTDSSSTAPNGTPKQETGIVDNRLSEPWISKPKTEWPQIVLTNHADFNGSSSLHGASGFLIKTDDDRVLAATAAHLLGSAGGVEPRIPVNQLTSKIRSWKMFPRTMSDDSVEITSLGIRSTDNESLDWLILLIKDSKQLPSYPLKLRKEPVRIGEGVFLIGCPYVEKACKQNVYAGVVTERGFGDRFRFDISPPVNIRGFSGAPIIDQMGYVVGVMTVWFKPKMSGENYLEAGGEDAASVYDLLQSGN